MFEREPSQAEASPASFPSDFIRAPKDGVILDTSLLTLELERGAAGNIFLNLSFKDHAGSSSHFAAIDDLESKVIESIRAAAASAVQEPLGELELMLSKLRILGSLVEPIESAVDEGAVFNSPFGKSMREAACLRSESWLSAVSRDDLARLITASEIRPGIILVSASSQILLANSFLRLQEHYESPRFKGTTFSLEDFKAWYSEQESAQGFSYYVDWGGFNLPGQALRSFESLFKVDGMPAEMTLRNKLSAFERVNYVIGTVEFDAATLRHELAHALYATAEEYRKAVSAVLTDVDTTEIRDWLRKTGYDPSVFEDEIQAYLNEGPEDLRDYGFGTPPILDAAVRIRAIYDRFFSEEASIRPRN